MTHYFLEEGQIKSSEDVCHKNKVELLINVMHHHMEGILQETEQPRKFSNQVFIGLLYSEIVLNGLNIVIDVREWAILTEGMKCICKGFWWCKFFMYGG